MEITTKSDFKNNIDQYIKQVCNDAETLIINDEEGKNVVVISLDEYNALQSTEHELSCKANKQRLDEAIANYNNDNGFEKELVVE